jgi:hypothetical protein
MRRWYALLLALLLAPPAPSTSACPGCKEALMEPGQLAERRATAAGYAASIALLLSVPAALVGGTAALLWRARRRKRRTVSDTFPALKSV